MACFRLSFNAWQWYVVRSLPALPCPPIAFTLPCSCNCLQILCVIILSLALLVNEHSLSTLFGAYVRGLRCCCAMSCVWRSARPFCSQSIRVFEVRVVSTAVVSSCALQSAVTTACAKRTGAAASVERRRREPDGAISPE
jgi:hypothetical protein